MSVVLSVTIMSVELFVAIVSTTNAWVTIFIKIMPMGVSVAIMQVVFSAVHYAHGYFYCNYVGDCFCCTYVCDSFKQLHIPFSN